MKPQTTTVAFIATKFIEVPSVEKFSGLKKSKLVDLARHCQLKVKPSQKKAEILALVLSDLVEQKSFTRHCISMNTG